MTNLDALKADVVRRCAAKCEHADIGATIRVRIDKKTVVSGELVAVEPATPYVIGTKVACGFRVTLLCGTDRVKRQFTLSSIPAA